MTLSLVGVGLIQYFWIMKAVALDEKNFNDKVTIALNNVKKKMTSDAETLAATQYYEGQGLQAPLDLVNESIVPGKKVDIQNQSLEQRLKDLEFRNANMKPDDLLDNIDKDLLDKYLKAELETKDIDLHYEYGVYSNKYRSYFIENGSYTATIGDTTKSSNVAAMNPLSKAEFKIALFDDE